MCGAVLIPQSLSTSFCRSFFFKNVYVCVFLTCVQMARELKEGPRAGVTDNCELPDRGAGN